MKTIIIAVLALFSVQLSPPDAYEILQKVDANMSSDNRIFESTMIVHGRRRSRTITSKSWSEGSERSLTEYLSPAREQGTKMLKLAKELWIFSPSSDRTIKISGHMMRQSVMGSDLSYEDMMEDRKLTDVYHAEITGEEEMDGRLCYVLELTAKVEDVAYQSRKTWIDKERFVPLREELFAKSGQLLKRTDLSEVEQIQGRWFPKKIVYKDMLKDGKGTEFIMTNISFNQNIAPQLFTKASLK
ncbi:MAG: outer membrane lipoprotein-sorting protein [Bacteroidota bacterium]